MSLNPNATATINIRGLAVCREVQNKWDIIFLHPKENQEEEDAKVTHKLTISIIERTKFNPNGVLKYSKMLNIGSRIEITAEAPISASDIYEPDNWLVEKGCVWMINLDRFHSPQGVKLKSNPNVFQSYLSISNSIFYAEERTPNLYKIIEEDGSQLQKRRIGYLAGADIQCAIGGKIIINGIPNPPALPSINGVKYEIILDNSCDSQDCNGREDFHHYYNNLDWTGSKIDIEKTSESGKGNALLMSDEAACNPIIGGNGSDSSFLEFYEKNLPKS